MTTDEKELLMRIAEDDSDAFRELFYRWYPKVKVMLAGIAINKADAEDLAQTVFVKLWVRRSLLPEIRSFGGYLYRMCRNAALDYAKKHRIQVELSEGDAESYPLDEDYFAREMRARLESRIARMPEKRRQVITLSRLEGKSNDEIAATLGITKKTVENHLNAALRELRKITSCLLFFL